MPLNSCFGMTKLLVMEKLLKEKGPFNIVDLTGEYSEIVKLVERKGGNNEG